MASLTATHPSPTTNHGSLTSWYVKAFFFPAAELESPCSPRLPQYTNPIPASAPPSAGISGVAGSPLLSGLIFVSVVAGVLALGLAYKIFGERLLRLRASSSGTAGSQHETEKLIQVVRS